MEITVRGIPAPQGSKRHVGGGRMIESSKAVGPWREAVRAETQRAMEGEESYTGPVSVRLVFLLPRPRGHYGTGRNAGKVRPSAPALPAGKPDLDKLERAVLDGISAGGGWCDDAQVVHLQAWKEYADQSEHPGCYIEIREVRDD
jgi:crossover junction endodeoxyribonuclease RusA